MAELIKVNYKTQPQGQVGPKPRKVKPGTELRFDCDDPTGDFEVEFLGESPLSSGAKKATRNQQVFAGTKPGVYKFKCTHNGIIFGDTNNPGPGGGELEVGPG